VQLASWAGIRVVATAATDDVAFARELGADTVVDFQTERFEDAAREVDAVLDVVDGDVAAWRERPVERAAHVIDLAPVVRLPLGAKLPKVMRMEFLAKPR